MQNKKRFTSRSGASLFYHIYSSYRYIPLLSRHAMKLYIWFLGVLIWHAGKFFDFRVFSLFGIFLGFENSAIKSATASTDGLMVTWEVPAILKHASGAFGPALPNYCACIKFDSGWACSVQFMFSLILDSQGRGLPCTTLLLSWSRAMEDRRTQPR